jgi:hypothetical protein
MDNSDKGQFAEVIGTLCLAYSRDNSPELMRLYFADLEEFSIEQIKLACAQIRKSPAAHFPRVGEIIAKIRGDRKGNAHEAWAEVVGTIGSLYHANNPPKFDDPRINRALSVIGGYKQVCLTPYDEQQWLQKRFIEAYETADSSIHRNEIQQIGRDDASEVLQKLNSHEQRRLQ